MVIERVALQNVKSHEESCFDLGSGLTLIVGPNGSGKTTILEAIGLTLFDQKEYTYDELAREGARGAEITVGLHARDGTRHQVVRRFGGYSDLTIYNADDVPLTESKADALDWLSEHLGVEVAAYGRQLWNNVVGVPQGKMTAVFLDPLAVRKAIFEPLLRVDEYDKAWASLSASVSLLKNRIQTIERDAAGLRGELKRRPEVERGIAELVDRIERDREAFAQARATADRLQTELKCWEHAEQSLREALEQLRSAENELALLQSRAGNARQRLEEAETAARIVAESRTGYEGYLAARERRRTLETRQRARAAVRETLAGTERELEATRARLESIEGGLREAAAAEARLRELAPLVEEQARLERARDDARQQLKEREAALEAVRIAGNRLRTLSQRLEAVRAGLAERARLEEQLERLDRRHTGLQARAAELDGEAATAQAARPPLEAAWRDDVEAERECQRLQQSLERELKALDNCRRDLATVEAQVRERAERLAAIEAIAAEITAVQGQQAQARVEADQAARALETLEGRLAVLQAAEEAACPVCKSPLDEHRAGELAAEFARERQRLTAARDGAEGRRRTAAEEVERLARRRTEEERTLKTLATPERAEELRADIRAEEEEIERWREAIAALEARAGSVEARKAALDEADATAAQLLEEREEVMQTIRQVTAESLNLSTRMRDLPPPGRQAELEEELALVEQERAEQQARADERAPAQDALDAAEEALAALGDPRGEAAGRQAIAGRGPALLKEREAGETRQRGLEEERQAQLAALQVFAALDEELDATDREIAATEEDHRRYTANERVAGELEERRRTLEALQGQVADAIARRDALAGRHAEAESAYDGEQHRQTREAHEVASQAVAQLDGRIVSGEEQLEEKQRELEQLDRVQARLDEKEAERQRLIAQSDALGFVRAGIRQAGPVIARRLVQAVSYQADRIFRDVLGDPSLRLTWERDYGITVTHGSASRSFMQLSGGEQMVASISVRMALLMELSAIRTLFLDEPTAFLDEVRRDQLADRIGQIDGLQQIVVITHDDAFAREGDRVIRLYKDPLTNRTGVA